MCNIDFWAITIGLFGTLIPIIYTKLKNKKMRKIIVKYEKDTSNKIEALQRIMEYERKINKTNNKMQFIIFTMIMLSYVLQLISLVWK